MADPGKHKRPLYPPSHPKGPVPDGDDIVGVKRAISRAGFMDWQEFDDAYNEKVALAVAAFQRAKKLDVSGSYGEPTHSALRKANVPSGARAGQDCFDDRAAALYKNYLTPDSVPDLGPVFKGGKSVLYQDLTHATSGIPLFPAWDDAFDEGCVIIAPEALRITKASSWNRGCLLCGVDDGVEVAVVVRPSRHGAGCRQGVQEGGHDRKGVPEQPGWRAGRPCRDQRREAVGQGQAVDAQDDVLARGTEDR